MKTIIALLLIALGPLANAQVLRVVYLDSALRETSVDAAVSKYEYLWDSSVANHFVRNHTNMHGNILLSTVCLGRMDPDMYDGDAVFYHPGLTMVSAKGAYRQYNQNGLWQFYYSDGRSREIRDYDLPKDVDVEYQVKVAYDSVGNQIVENGQGYYVEYINMSMDQTKWSGTTQGAIINGLKDGAWTGVYTESGDVFKESYDKGKLVGGVRIDSARNEYSYTQVEASARPRDGMQSFYKLIATNMKYPKIARRMGIEGKVFVQFIVNKDGTLSDLRVLKGILKECDDEALRAVQASPPWEAGTIRGKNVRQKMVLPITFKLN